MPVIGRLDDQVNDVLINPIGTRRTRDESVDADAPSNDSEQGATEEDAREQVHRASGDETRTTRVEALDARVRVRAELPVWLL